MVGFVSSSPHFLICRKIVIWKFRSKG